MKRLAALLAVISVLPCTALADSPAMIPVQGRLTDAAGVAVNDVFAVNFTLYASDQSTQLWTEQTSVNFVDGFFTAYLGSTVILDLALFRDNGTIFLGVKVGNDAEMTPFELGSSPFAAYAQFAGSAADLADAAKLQIVDDVAVQLENDAKVHDRYTDAEALSAVTRFPARTQADARASCQAIIDAGVSSGDGLYWLDPNGGDVSDAFQAYCEMTTLGGGWTLASNIHPADGGIVSFTNTRFWLDDLEYGSVEEHFTHDYKSPAAWTMTGTNIMVQIANPGARGKVIGYKAWAMPAKSFDAFFDAPINTTQTTSVLGEDVADVYAYEPLIKNGAQLQSNRQINPNADRVRLGVDGYSAQGDDNQPGLGTQMNEAICGAGNNCYRFKDVELWVNSNGNLWCTAPSPGAIAWIGTDGGCGANCASSLCDHIAGPGYSPYWTYRIFIR